METVHMLRRVCYRRVSYMLQGSGLVWLCRVCGYTRVYLEIDNLFKGIYTLRVTATRGKPES